VTVEESEDPNHVCNFLNMHHINVKCQNAMRLFFIEDFDENSSITDLSENGLKQKQNKTLDELQQLSQHMHVNAFSNMWMGSNTNGLMEALPHDMMHAFLHGVLMYVIEVIMSPLNPTEKFKLDGIVDKIIVPIRSSSRAQFPR